MAIEREAFTPTRTEEERSALKGKPVSIWLNNEEMARFEALRAKLQQDKVSTIIKQTAELGAYLLEDSLTARVMDTVLKNMGRNEKRGVWHIEPK